MLSYIKIGGEKCRRRNVIYHVIVAYLKNIDQIPNDVLLHYIVDIVDSVFSPSFLTLSSVMEEQ